MKLPDLIPCKICGSVPTIRKVKLSFFWSGYTVKCPKCNIPRSVFFEEIHAINDWNGGQRNESSSI